MANAVAGWVAPGYERVREAFASNLNTGEERGAALAVHRFGRPVVDLRGGADDDGGRPRPVDALQVGYSVTKGVLGIVLAQLVAEGVVDLGARVVDYWPEFGAARKALITVDQLASHQAGLPFFEEPTSIADLSSWSRCTERLARQAPIWEPGSRHGYHALTIGFLVGEVIRRASGRSVGQLLRDSDSAGDLDAWIGLPDAEAARVLPCRAADPTPGTGAVRNQALAEPLSITSRTFTNPEVTVDAWNDPSTWGAEMPAVNGVFSACALARLYSRMVDGELRTVPVEVVDTMRRPRTDGPDQVLVDQPTKGGALFMLSSPRQPMLGPGSFGHDGLGGHLAFAHPESGIAFAYLSTRAIEDPSPHARIARLTAGITEALHAGSRSD